MAMFSTKAACVTAAAAAVALKLGDDCARRSEFHAIPGKLLWRSLSLLTKFQNQPVPSNALGSNLEAFAEWAIILHVM